MTSRLDADRIAVLVHEVRSPVAALSAIAETLADGDVEHDGRQTLIRLVVTACTGIERIVTDVAVASIRFERIDPGGLVEDVVAAARFRGAAVDLSLPADMPTVRGDPSRRRAGAASHGRRAARRREVPAASSAPGATGRARRRP